MLSTLFEKTSEALPKGCFCKTSQAQEATVATEGKLSARSHALLIPKQLLSIFILSLSLDIFSYSLAIKILICLKYLHKVTSKTPMIYDILLAFISIQKYFKISLKFLFLNSKTIYICFF